MSTHAAHSSKTSMKASILVKATLASLLHSTGVHSRRFARYTQQDNVILMYHRVIPSREMSPSVQAGMVVQPRTLELHIQYLRQHFEIVPLSRLASAWESRASSTRPLCALTFDDGWADFYQHAYPILRRLRAPATVFLPTAFIGTSRCFWTDRLALLLEAVDRKPPGVSSRWQCPELGEIADTTEPYETRLERSIALLKPCRSEKIDQLLSALSLAIGEDGHPPARMFLTWEEVEAMFESGLVSFGSHTAGHRLLSTLADQEVEDELKESMAALRARGIAAADFVSFSYPNGDFSARLAEMVRDSGYSLAVTTRPGWNHPGSNPYALKRIGVHQDMAATQALLGSRIFNAL
jgi:peptidoglycan/xylan/chitin deacetylase (PgdA/CDA1 family)